MGQCCSTGGGVDSSGVTKKHDNNVQLPLFAPKPQQTPSRSAAWQTTGIIGLRDQGLKALPNNVWSVGADAKVLDATNNAIVELPPTITGLVNLQRLVLASNQLVSLPGTPLAALTALRLLNLDNNRLAALPPEVGQLPRLEKLVVSRNALTRLPSLAGCGRLQQLHAAQNRLDQLPEQLPEEIEEVDASGNRITAIPASYQRLTRLKVLNCDGNLVQDVPSEVLAGCEALHTLSLHDNPITPDVLQSNPGFDAFEARRRSKYSKGIAGGVLLGARGLDEGVDRKT